MRERIRYRQVTRQVGHRAGSYGRADDWRRAAGWPTRQQLTEEQIHNFYDAHVEGLKANDKGFAWGHCPFHADRSPSFSVNLRTGRFECKSASCGAAGTDPVGFVIRLHGCSYAEAVGYLESQL
jgi:hypothetical protein